VSLRKADVWTCDRCGREAEVERVGTMVDRPPGWIDIILAGREPMDLCDVCLPAVLEALRIQLVKGDWTPAPVVLDDRPRS